MPRQPQTSSQRSVRVVWETLRLTFLEPGVMMVQGRCVHLTKVPAEAPVKRVMEEV